MADASNGVPEVRDQLIHSAATSPAVLDLVEAPFIRSNSLIELGEDGLTARRAA